LLRQQLAARNIPYTKEQFVREAEAGNTAVVELFLSAGMDPDTTQTFVDYSALDVLLQPSSRSKGSHFFMKKPTARVCNTA
jgi:hypothetical protein